MVSAKFSATALVIHFTCLVISNGALANYNDAGAPALESAAITRSAISATSHGIMPHVRSLREASATPSPIVSGVHSVTTQAPTAKSTNVLNIVTTPAPKADRVYSPKLYEAAPATSKPAEPLVVTTEPYVRDAGKETAPATPLIVLTSSASQTTAQPPVVEKFPAAEAKAETKPAAPSVITYPEAVNPPPPVIITGYNPQAGYTPAPVITAAGSGNRTFTHAYLDWSDRRLISRSARAPLPDIIAPSPAEIAQPQQQPATAQTEEEEEGGLFDWLSELFCEKEPEETAQQPAASTYVPRTIVGPANGDLTYMKAASIYPGQPLAVYANYVSATGISAIQQAPALSSTIAETSVTLPLTKSLGMVYIPAKTASEQAPPKTEDKATKTEPYPAPVNKINLETGAKTAPEPENTRPAAPATISGDGKWGIFVSSDTRFGDEKLIQDGNETSTLNAGGTVGIDYRVEDNNYVGLALTYARANFTTDGVSETQGDSFALSLYGTNAFAKRAYLDGFISAGFSTFDSERTVNGGTIRTASSSPTAFHVASEAEAGYNFIDDTTKLGPFAGFKTSYISLDGADEEGAGNANLATGDYDEFSAVGVLGIGASRQFTTDGGAIITPGIRVAYNHEFGDNRTNVASHPLSNSRLTLTTEGVRRERDWLSINPAISAALTKNWLIRLSYERDIFRDDEAENIFNVGASYKW